MGREGEVPERLRTDGVSRARRLAARKYPVVRFDQTGGPVVRKEVYLGSSARAVGELLPDNMPVDRQPLNQESGEADTKNDPRS